MLPTQLDKIIKQHIVLSESGGCDVLLHDLAQYAKRMKQALNFCRHRLVANMDFPGAAYCREIEDGRKAEEPPDETSAATAATKEAWEHDRFELMADLGELQKRLKLYEQEPAEQIAGSGI